MSHIIDVTVLKKIYFNNKKQQNMLNQADISRIETFSEFSDFARHLLNDLKYPTPQSNKFETYGWVPTLYDYTQAPSRYEEGLMEEKWQRNGAAEYPKLSLFYLDVDNDRCERDDEGNDTHPLPKVTQEEIIEKLTELGLQFVTYTSYSHKADHHKFRVVMPVSRPISRAAMARLFIWFNWEILGRQGDGSIYDPGDFLYAPPYNGVGGFHNGVNGVALDVDAYEEKAQILIRSNMKAISYQWQATTSKTRKQVNITPEQRKELAARRSCSARSEGATIYNEKLFNPILLDHYKDEKGSHSRWEIMRRLLGHVWVRSGGKLTGGDMEHIFEEIIATHPKVIEHESKTGQLNVWLGWSKGIDERDKLIDFIMSNPVEEAKAEEVAQEEEENEYKIIKEKTGLKYMYVEGECGEGKTEWAMNLIANNPGRYILALPKVQLINEVKARLENKYGDLRELVGYQFKTIYSKINANMKDDEDDDKDEQLVRDTVTKQIHEYRTYIDNAKKQNVVLFITHAALFQTEWIGWDDFTLIIDEVPEVYINYTQDFQENAEFIEKYIEITGQESNYYRLGLTNQGQKKFEEGGHFDSLDELVQGILEAIKNPNIKVYAQKRSWDERTKQKVRFLRLVNPEFLGFFESVTIMGDEFRKSLMALVWERTHDVKWIPHPTWKPGRQRPFAIKSRVKLHYFSDTRNEGRRASKTLFEDDAMRVLPRVKAWISENAPGGKQTLITTNNSGKKQFEQEVVTFEDRETHDGVERVYHVTRPSMVWVTSKTHGLNVYRNMVNCAWFAAMRPGADELEFLQAALGITEDEIIRWREYNSMYQFVMRVNLRVYESNNMCNIYLWDREQVEYFMQRWGNDLDIELHDDVVEGNKKGKKGRKSNEEKGLKAPKSSAERKAASVARKKERELSSTNNEANIAGDSQAARIMAKANIQTGGKPSMALRKLTGND